MTCADSASGVPEIAVRVHPRRRNAVTMPWRDEKRHNRNRNRNRNRRLQQKAQPGSEIGLTMSA